MREYIYNVRMALKRNRFPDSISLIFTLTCLHFKKFFIRGVSPKKTRIHGRIIYFFSYATLTGLYEEIFIQRQYYFEAKRAVPAVIDCGSNIGMAVLYFKHIYPAAKITAFEPDPATFVLLKKTIEANGFKDVTAVNRAVAAKKGTALFYSYKDSPGNLHMSLVKSRVKDGSPYRVQMDRLSSYIKGTLDFVKIDVEGAEAEVIGELCRSGKIRVINSLAVEIHHNIPGGKDVLNAVTGALVKYGFNYVLSATPDLPVRADAYQDILLFAGKK